ncbi:MAG: hypothetical protein LLF80_00575 [Porphyromonadaceae bacterium]|nr:hypothetical protein [Porphyromonadaceae bacterium]
MSEAEQSRQLKTYDFRSIFDVVPTDNTVAKLNGHGLLMKMSNKGFAVWSKVKPEENDTPFVSLDDHLFLTFLILLKDPYFYNFTDLILSEAGKLFYLSNRKPATEPESFPLLDKADKDHPVDEKFILSEEGMENELKKSEIKPGNNCFGIVCIFMKGDKSSLHITDAQGKISTPPKMFELTFRNRSTFWRYIFNAAQPVKPADDVIRENGNAKILVTKKAHPLTRYGFISLKLNKAELPNPNALLIKPDLSTTKIFSEIYM